MPRGLEGGTPKRQEARPLTKEQASWTSKANALSFLF